MSLIGSWDGASVGRLPPSGAARDAAPSSPVVVSDQLHARALALSKVAVSTLAINTIRNVLRAKMIAVDLEGDLGASSNRGAALLQLKAEGLPTYLFDLWTTPAIMGSGGLGALLGLRHR